MKKVKPLVSIIIPTKNAASRYGLFEETLRSVKNQTYPNIELIVSDNFSSDETVKIAKNFKARIIFKGPERTSQVNFAAQKARGEYIAKEDDDYLINDEYIEKAVSKCQQGFDAVYHSTVSSGDNFWVKAKALERLAYVGDDSIECAWFWKRKVFLALGGYDTKLVAGEDFDLQERLNAAGYKTGRINVANIHLGESKSLKEIFLKNVNYGKTVSPYLKKNTFFRARKLFPLRKAFLKNWRLFINNPFLSLGLIIIKVTQYFGAILGFLLSFLSE